MRGGFIDSPAAVEHARRVKNIDVIPRHAHRLRRLQGDLAPRGTREHEATIRILELRRQFSRRVRRVRTREDASAHYDAHDHHGEEDVIARKQHDALAGLKTASTEAAGQPLGIETVRGKGYVFGDWVLGV